MLFNHRTVKGQARVNPRMPRFVLLNQNLEPGLFPGVLESLGVGGREGKEGGRGKKSQTKPALGHRTAPPYTEASLPPSPGQAQ